MPARLVALWSHAIDPSRLAEFWGHALNREVSHRPNGTVILGPNGAGLSVVFAPGAAPKVGQNRNHLDVTTESVADQHATVAHLVAIGARHVDVGQGAQDTHVVLADPEGNELCVLAPGNRFLEGCGRLGAINCDGTRVTGVFWSAVLGWPLVWDQDEETAIRVPGASGPMITWSGPPLRPKARPNRLQLAIAAEGDHLAETERLAALGARRLDADSERVLMADPDGNEFRVVTAG